VLDATEFRILGSVVEGDSTHVVYRLSNTMARNRQFPTILSTLRTPTGYSVIPEFSPEDAILGLGLQCGSE
jgi:hypothetical protein